MEWELLAGLSDADARRVLATTRRRSFARGEVLFHEGDPAAALHLIERGRVAVRVTTPLGDVATLDVLQPGGVLGELALLFPDGVRGATAVALEPVTTLAVDAATFAALRRDVASVDQVLVRVLASRLRQVNARLLEALYVPADVRVLRRVVELAGSYGGTVPLTQEDLAGLAGTTRATVNRVLRREERAGAVRLDRGRVTLLDEAGLTRRSR